MKNWWIEWKRWKESDLKKNWGIEWKESVLEISSSWFEIIDLNIGNGL